MKIKISSFITLLFFSISLFSQTLDKTKGKVSYYSDKLHGRPTASGEKYDKTLLTAAHKTLPFGTMVQIKNTKNQKTVVVKINDRGPHTDTRIMDISRKAAEELGMIKDGIVEVELDLVSDSEKTSGPTKEPARTKDNKGQNPDDKTTLDDYFDEPFDEFQEDDLKFDDKPESVTKDDKSKVTPPKKEETADSKTEPDKKSEETAKPTGTESDGISNDKPFYAVQVSAFKKQSTAERFAAKLKNQGFPMVYIQKIVYKNRDMYRVLVLHYNSKTEAENTLNSLKKAGLKPILKTYQFNCK